MAKVLVCDAMSEGPLNKIRACPYLELTYSPEVTPEELLTAVKGMDAMVVRSRTKVTEPVIDAFDTMRLIVRGGVGVDNIKVDYAKSKGVETRNTPAAASASVAELAIAMMFCLARKLNVASNTMHAGQWDKKAFSKGVELSGKTLGVIGLGRIGRETAKRGEALGMKVIGYDPQVKAGSVTEAQVGEATLDELCEKADFITLHVPHNDSTHYMLNAARLGQMKKSAFIINCARGGVVDEAALAEALKAGTIKGAAIDVFEKEPPEVNHFLGLENVLMAPHIGAQTVEGQERVGDEVAQVLMDYFAAKAGA
jgi:D-3-phosphoglycerate dehydrogenase / 2-oxoglutarate reductase